MTRDQTELFTRTPNLKPVDELPDGDMLALDRNSTEDNPLGPYIVTVAGRMETVANHYRNPHKLPEIWL